MLAGLLAVGQSAPAGHPYSLMTKGGGMRIRMLWPALALALVLLVLAVGCGGGGGGY
jgi:hypothetical protein